MPLSLPDPIHKFLTLLAEAGKSFSRHNGFVYAGNMAFIGMLSAFPFFIVLVALSGLIGQTQFGLEAINFIYAQIPENVVDQIKGPINMVVGETSRDILTISILVALWTATRGLNAARHAVMKAYGTRFQKVSHALLGYLENLGLVFASIILILATLFILVLGPAIFQTVESWLPVPIEIAKYWDLARYVVSPIALYLALIGLYFVFGPKYSTKSIYFTPGALLCLSIWFAMAGLFSLYLRFVGDLDLIYGSLTGVVVFQVFLFFLSIGFILGAELNARYTKAKTAKK